MVRVHPGALIAGGGGSAEHAADYASALAERYRWVRYYTPVNEIYATALFSSAYGWWNEMMSDAAFVTNSKRCVKASMLIMRALLDLRPDSIFTLMFS